VLVNLLQGAEDRATKNRLPTWARHLGDHVNERIGAIARVRLILLVVLNEANLAKDLLYLRLSLVGV